MSSLDRVRFVFSTHKDVDGNVSIRYSYENFHTYVYFKIEQYYLHNMTNMNSEKLVNFIFDELLLYNFTRNSCECVDSSVTLFKSNEKDVKEKILKELNNGIVRLSLELLNNYLQSNNQGY